jgi:carboxylesterase type B
MLTQILAVFRDISTRPDLRAWHASELPLVFGTYNQSTEIPKTADEIALSKYMQSAWVSFARDPQKGLNNFGWPNYDPSSQSLVQLGNFFNKSSATFGTGTEIDFACSKVQTLAAITGQVNSLLLP